MWTLEISPISTEKFRKKVLQRKKGNFLLSKSRRHQRFLVAIVTLIPVALPPHPSRVLCHSLSLTLSRLKALLPLGGNAFFEGILIPFVSLIQARSSRETNQLICKSPLSARSNSSVRLARRLETIVVSSFWGWTEASVPWFHGINRR